VEEIGAHLKKITLPRQCPKKVRYSTDSSGSQNQNAAAPFKNKEEKSRDEASTGTVEDGDQKPHADEKKDDVDSELIHNSAKGYGEN
jgi:hypothetical protein